MKELNTSWAANPVKLKRAMDTLTKQVTEGAIKSFSEKDLKTLYISYAGALRE